MKFWNALKKFFLAFEKRILRVRAHRQKQYCYASIARQEHPDIDPCDQCRDANCPAKLLEVKR